MAKHSENVPKFSVDKLCAFLQAEGFDNESFRKNKTRLRTAVFWNFANKSKRWLRPRGNEAEN